MNTNLERSLIFILGGAIGSGVTYVLMRMKHQKDNDELFKMLDEEEKELKSRLRELEERYDLEQYETVTSGYLEVNPVDEEDIEETSESKKAAKIAKKAVEGIKKGLKNNQKTDYATYYSEGHEIFASEEELAEEEFPQEDAPPIAPYIISLDEFTNENAFYSKSYITYFEGDDTLADEHDEIIDDRVKYIGDSALHAFGDNPDEPDIVHVRNDTIGVDYEITREEGSYKEIVLGIYDD